MECPNCGAHLEENQRICSYCGYENTEVAMKEQESFIQSIYRKTAELFKIPERIVRKTVKMIVRVMIICVILFAVILLVKFMWIRHEKENAIKTQNEALETLENYYQNKEYGEMYKYLLSLDESYESVYYKYNMVGSLNQTFHETKNFVKQDLAYEGENNPEIFGGYIAQYTEILNKIAILEDGGFAYGEKEALLYYRKEVMKELKNTLKMTDEEIEKACGYKMGSSEMNELGRKVVERLGSDSNEM